MNETEMKVMTEEEWSLTKAIIYNHDDQMQAMGHRIIALERALEAVLSKIEASDSPGAPGTDEPGWFGVTE